MALLARPDFVATEVLTDPFRLRFADGSALLRNGSIRAGFMPGWKRLEVGAPWPFPVQDTVVLPTRRTA